MCPDPSLFLYGSGTGSKSFRQQYKKRKTKQKNCEKNLNSDSYILLVGISLLNLSKNDNIINGNPSCELMPILQWRIIELKKKKYDGGKENVKLTVC